MKRSISAFEPGAMMESKMCIRDSRGTGNAVDGGAGGGHDLLGQLFQCSAADALGLL